LWGLTSFFNPIGYKNKVKNYRKFRLSSQKQGLKLLCVELSFGGREPELTKDDADILIQLRSNTILWQKERLLNIGLRNLPDDCTKIIWIDCDIIFQNDNWVEEVYKSLDKYFVIQPFSFVIRLPKDGIISSEDLPFGLEEGQKIHSMGYGMRDSDREKLFDFFIHGHSGFAWAARREIFNKHGFYDRLILGSGDLMMAHTFYGHKFNYIRSLSSEPMQLDQDVWFEEIYNIVKSNVYFVPGLIFHLWHGDKINKLHDERFEILVSENFDPRKDIKLDSNDCWTWATNKPKLHQWCEKYFSFRKEE